MPEDNGNKVTKPQFLRIIYLLAFVLLLVWAINAIITYTKLSSNQSFLGRLTSSVLLQKPLTQDNVKYVRLQGPQGAPGPQGKIGLTGPSGTSGCINSQCLSLQSLTPGVQETGNINISGSVLANTIIATTIQGDGSGLTNVNANKLNGNDSSYYTNASNLTTGTIANNLLSNTVTEQGNNFNSPNQLLQLNSSGGLPAISGANLTDLNASNISTGTLADNLLSADVPLLNSNNLFQPSIDSANTLNINTTTGSNILNVNTNPYTVTNNSGIPPWTTSTSTLPQALNEATSVTYNGYVYVMGGMNNSGNSSFNTVYYAPLNSNGSVGSWTTSTNTLPQALGGATSVTYNGYVYVMGGDNGSYTGQNTVYYAPLNSNGSVGSWTTSTSTLPQGLNEATSVTYNGYVYVMGGWSDGVYYTLLPGPTTIGQGSVNTNGVLVATNNTYLQALTANGAVLLQDSTNSTSAFEVQNTAGSTVLAVDTVNGRVGIGTNSPQHSLDVAGNINTSGNYLINGVQISASNLSDSANIARLNANQTFSGANTFSGMLTLNGHYNTGNSSGSTAVTAGSAAGTSPTVSINGNDVSGTITITTGSSAVSSGTIVNVVFANAYGATPSVVISSDNAATAILENYVSGISTTGFSIDTANTTVASTTYVYSYFVTQ